MNHCEHCHSNQGDFYLHSEPGGAFLPLSETDAQYIKLYWFEEPLEIYADSYSVGG